MNSATPFYLLTFVPHVLVVAGLAVGLTLAFVRRAQLGPRAFILAVVGMILMIIVELAGMVLSAGVLRALNEEFGFRLFGVLMALYSAFSLLLFATGLGLLVAAIFAGRPRGQSPSPS